MSQPQDSMEPQDCKGRQPHAVQSFEEEKKGSNDSEIQKIIERAKNMHGKISDKALAELITNQLKQSGPAQK